MRKQQSEQEIMSDMLKREKGKWQMQIFGENSRPHHQAERYLHSELLAWKL